MLQIVATLGRYLQSVDAGKEKKKNAPLSNLRCEFRGGDARASHARCVWSWKRVSPCAQSELRRVPPLLQNFGLQVRTDSHLIVLPIFILFIKNHLTFGYGHSQDLWLEVLH